MQIEQLQTEDKNLTLWAERLYHQLSEITAIVAEINIVADPPFESIVCNNNEVVCNNNKVVYN